jgi:hypothetical protein
MDTGSRMQRNFKDAEELLDALWEDCIDHDLLNF